jgi:hypothetical protein
MGIHELASQTFPGLPPSGYAHLWIDATTKKLVQTDDTGKRFGLLSKNFSTVSQSPATSTDVYLTNSGILIPSFGMEAGQRYSWMFTATKSTTGTTAYVATLRLGTNQTTADTARATLTANQVQTAVASHAIFFVEVLVRSVSATGQLIAAINCASSTGTTATGFGGGVVNVPATFDNTAVAGQYLGISINTQAGAWTIDALYASLES